MDIITLDFETFYDRDYSLSKMTTEEYIRDPRFQVIGVSTKINEAPAVWVTGTEEEIRVHIRSLPWGTSLLLAQNTMFDGAILGWRYGVHPKVLADTMLMSRALDGVDESHSLKSLARRYDVGEKGDEVIAAMGKRKEDFTPEGLAAYGRYCVNDVELTFSIFTKMLQDFPMSEMRLVDLTLRMFTRPLLELDRDHLEAHLTATRDKKAALLEATSADKKSLMSNPQFAEMLRAFDVEPPMKISPTTGKETYAFAKTDQGFRDLEDHEDERVQALVAARLGNKSTLEETRTERFIGIAKRGALPVPIRYYAAHTGRWGGSDKINLQNLPSRGPNAKQIKNSILAPAGYTLVDADSSQIEARVLAWLAGQNDLVAAFAAGEDVYKLMASSIYDKAVEDITPSERFMGKTTILGCGYQMGPTKFRLQTATMGVDLSEVESERIIRVYRETYGDISAFWNTCRDTIPHIYNGDRLTFGRDHLLLADGRTGGVRLPSGLYIYYRDMDTEQGEFGPEYTYATRKGRKKLYGGLMTENICQALARAIIGYQMTKIGDKYPVVLTVHDSIVICVPEDEAEEAKGYMEACMKTVPDWAAGLPVTCEADIGVRYGG